MLPAKTSIISSGSFNNLYFLDFDGGNDYVELGNITELNGASANTVSCWVKTTQGTRQGAWMVKDGDNTQYGLQFHENASSNSLLYFNDGSANIYAQGTHTHGIWINYIVIFDGSLSGDANRLKMYSNGTKLTLSYSGGSIDSTISDKDDAIFTLGRTEGAATRYLNGNIDEFIIYNRAITDQEALAIYNNGYPGELVNTQGLLGYWRFEEGRGLSAYDESNNSRTGTLTNMDDADWVSY